MKNIYTYYLSVPLGISIGRIRADDEAQAKDLLRKRGKKILMLEPARTIKLSQIMGPRIGREQKLIFVKNLHVILKAGVALADALKIIEEQAETRSMKKIAQHLVKQIEAGNSLASALRHYDYLFNPFFINIIYVGESSGTLDQSLEYLSNELEHDLDLYRKVKAAALYPAIIISATIVLGGVMVQYVLPKLVRVFDSIHRELPPTTKLFLVIVRFLTDYGKIGLIALVAGLILGRLLIQLPTARYWWLRLLLKLPLFGKIDRFYNLALLTRTLGVLLQTGTPILDALQVAARATNNLYFKVALMKANERVAQGSSFGEALIANKQFSIMAARLVEVGEKAGSLETNLLYLASFYSNKIDYATRNLSTIIEPVLLIVIGLMVGFVAMALISPIYEFTGSVGR